MPSAQSFAVWLPLFLLGTMAIVAVFLPIGCVAPEITGSAVLNSGVIPSGPRLTGAGTISSQHGGSPSLLKMPSRSKIVPPLSVDNTSGSGRFTHLKPPSAMDGGFGLGPVGPEKSSVIVKSPAVAKTTGKKKQEGTKKEVELAEGIRESYAEKMHTTHLDGDDEKCLERAIKVAFLPMPQFNKESKVNQDGVRDLAISLNLIHQYDHLLTEYKAIKEEAKENEQRTNNGNADTIMAKENALANELIGGVLKKGDEGTGNPAVLLQRQIAVVQNAIKVLHVHPPVRVDVLPTEEADPVLHEKAKIKPQLENFVHFLEAVMEIFKKENGGQHLVHEGETAMQVIEEFERRKEGIIPPPQAMPVEAEVVVEDEETGAKWPAKDKKKGHDHHEHKDGGNEDHHPGGYQKRKK